MKQVYLIVSLKQANALARVIRRQKKLRPSSQYVSLHLTVSEKPEHAVDGREQVSSGSLTDSIEILNSIVALRERSAQ